MTFEQFSGGKEVKPLGMSAQEFSGGQALTTEQNAAILGTTTSALERTAPSLGDPGEVLSAAASTLNPFEAVKTAGKFVKSAVRSPVDIVRGIFGMKPLVTQAEAEGRDMPTYQSEFAESTVPAVESGQVSPLEATITSVGEPVLSGAGLIGIGKATGIGDVPLNSAMRGELRAAGSPLEKLTTAVKDRFGKTSAEKATEIVSPRLTPKVAREAQTKTSGLSRKIEVVPDNRSKEMGEALKDVVKGRSFSEDKELVRKAISDEAETLSKKVEIANHPIPRRELKSAIVSAERPVLIASDNTMNNAYDRVIKKAADIIDDVDGTVKGFFKGRKIFDDFVEQQFPNLYSSDAMTPMRTAIKNIRRSWNEYVSSQLPDNVGFQESLRKQNLMYDAVDNLSEKVALGAKEIQGEIGTKWWQRFGKKHPLIKKGAQIAGGATVAGAAGRKGYELVQ